MAPFAYLLLGLAFLALWLVMFAMRRDLRKTLLAAGLLGIPAGVLSEHWYFRDYWRPPLVWHWGLVSLEDALFGFVVAGVAAALVPWGTGKIPRKATAGQPRLFLALLVLFPLFLIVLCDVLGLQSIFVSMMLFLFYAAALLARRKDLLPLSLVSGIALAILMFPVYFVLFHILAPDYWSIAWLWTGTPLGFLIAPGIPWTEPLWYFCWGAFAGIAPHAVRGTALR